ncbi:MAG: AraC family transcriptional regulator [Lentisphaeria bacterium]|nr:AraC family transcriptional regulator [Lentisphaeria bacterium]MBQ7396151.1 AraC family transcriptional regulator [Lentisphaeria bacterium]
MDILRKADKNSEKTVVIHPFAGDERLAITSCGYTSAEDTQYIKREHSDLCVLQYIKSGCGYLKVNGKTIKSGAGDVIINHIGDDHEYWSDSKTPWSKVWLNVKGTLVTELLRIYQLEHITYIPNVSELADVFTGCIENLLEQNGDVVEETAISLHRIIHRINKAVYFSGKQTDSIAEKLRRRLNQEITSGKTFSEIALEFDLSESQLIRRFKNAYNCTPYAFLLDCRLELAKTMLINSSYSIAEISGRCGFSCQYYFSTLFKRKFKKSPKAYRNTPTIDNTR